MKYIVMQDAFFVVLLLVLAVPLGIYMYKVMIGEKVFLSRVLEPVERFGYRLMGVSEVGMSAKRYAVSVLAFSAVGFVFVMAVLMLQGFLPLNPEGMKGLSFSLAFNTAASFCVEYDWQAYSGEAALSYFFAVDWFNGAELCFGSDRDCSIICGNSWLYMEETENDRKFLARFISSDAIYSITTFAYFGASFSIARSGAVIC